LIHKAGHFLQSKKVGNDMQNIYLVYPIVPVYGSPYTVVAKGFDEAERMVLEVETRDGMSISIIPAMAAPATNPTPNKMTVASSIEISADGFGFRDRAA
jgi:hypothetical protein